MEILYVNPSSQLGGAELCLLDMMAETLRVRPDWRLALLAPGEGTLLQRAMAMGAQTHVLAYPQPLARLGDSGQNGRWAAALRLAGTAPAVLSYRRRLRKKIQQLAPDLIHANGLKASLLVSSAVSGTPVIWHMHDYLGSRATARGLARRIAERKPFVLAIANSNSVEADARTVFGNLDIATCTLHNAVNLEEFSSAGECADLDSLCGLPPAAPETLRVGLVCTMAWWKGQQDFIRALAHLPPERQVRGYVIGGPIYETRSRQFSIAELRAFARELGLEARVGFTGFTGNPAAAMRALDVVVHASSQPEPFGRVIVEAMACGKPVITAALGGARELILPGETALTFCAGNAEALAACIAELARDPELRRRLSRNGLIHARQNFDHRRLGPALAEIYEKLAGEIAPRASAAETHA